jgi:hypothetical protein
MLDMPWANDGFQAITRKFQGKVRYLGSWGRGGHWHKCGTQNSAEIPFFGHSPDPDIKYLALHQNVNNLI